MTWGVLCGWLLLVASPAFAGGFQIAPTIAEVSGGAKVASFQVRNDGDQPTAIQIDALDWRQDAQQGESLTAATDAVVVPRIATLPPHTSQLVRIATQGQVSNERAYRLRLREVPPPPPTGFTGVRTLIEQLVPVFFETSGAPDVAWHARLQLPGHVLLTAANNGTRHLQLTEIALFGAQGVTLAERHGPAYVLAGQTMGWTLPTHIAMTRGASISLQLTSHGARRDVALTLE